MTQEVLKKTIEEIDELKNERRYFMSYTLFEKSPHDTSDSKGAPRWVRSAFHTQEEVKKSITYMNTMQMQYEDLCVVPEDILDLNINSDLVKNQFLDSYNANLDSFGNIKEICTSLYHQREHAHETESLRQHMYDSRYTFSSPLPFFQKYNRYASIRDEAPLVVVDDKGKDITDKVVKYDYMKSFPSSSFRKV